jgi:hypothetical protein
MPHNKLHDPNGSGQDMSQGLTTPDRRRQQLCGTSTEAREAEVGQTDYFNKLVGPHWSKLARDRNEWKVLENQLNAVNHSR